MRFTYGQFRNGARDPTFRVTPGSRGGANPGSVLRKAVRVYHASRDADEGRRALEQGLSGYFARPGTPTRQAADARTRFETYLKMEAADARPVFDTNMGEDIAFGDDVLAVDVDLALFDPSGYAGRVILWDKLPCDREQARAIAGPAARCLADELGADRIVDVQVWHIRSQLRHYFDYAEAIDGLGLVPSILAAARPVIS